MIDINMANRQCCDLDIRGYKTEQLWMYADFYSTTTMGSSNNAAHVNRKGGKCTKFGNPFDGTISMTFQVHPFRVYAMLSDGEIETKAILTRKGLIKVTEAGRITLPNTPIVGTVLVYAEGDFGGKSIEGTLADKVSTAKTSSEVIQNKLYIVGYLEEKISDIQKVSFNNKKIPKDFFIRMFISDKNENGELVPMRITAYKASPQKRLDLSISSGGDLAEITITCDALMDENGNILDMIEPTDETG